MNILLELITGILLGLWIGMNISENMNKLSKESSDKLVSSQRELIETYDEYIKLIEKEVIRDYQKALDETLKQNIKLKKLLNGKGSKSY